MCFGIQGSNGKAHFIFVTNLTPCSGVRIHLWPEKSKSPLKDEVPSKRILEVTSKMVRIPAGPAPRQVHLCEVLMLCMCRMQCHFRLFEPSIIFRIFNSAVITHSAIYFLSSFGKCKTISSLRIKG